VEALSNLSDFIDRERDATVERAATAGELCELLWGFGAQLVRIRFSGVKEGLLRGLGGDWRGFWGVHLVLRKCERDRERGVLGEKFAEEELSECIFRVFFWREDVVVMVSLLATWAPAKKTRWFPQF
jgi:hypothetical protein